MPSRRPVVALALAVGTFHLVIGLIAWRSFRIGSWDLTLFDTIVRAYSEFRAPIEPALGIHLGVGPGLNAYGDHFSPILAVLAPLYWIRDDPRMLLLAQALLVALSTALTWRIAERALGAGTAYAVALGFGLAWPFQEASLTGFHESLFVVPLLLLAFERLQAERPGQAALWAATLVTVKEDMGLLTVFFGLLLALRGARRIGLSLAVFGLIAFYVTSSIVVPHYWGQGSPDGDYYEALKAALPNPVDTWDVVARPVQKEQTLGWLLLPWAFLPVLSTAVLVAIPQVGERFASSNPNHWGLLQHYNAVLMPILVVAAVEVARRMPRPMRLVWAGWVVVSAVFLVGRHPGQLLWDKESWRVDAREAAAAAAVSVVPPKVTVEADNELGPHLARRDSVLLLDKTPRDAPWVVVDVGVPSFPIDSVAAQRARVGDLQQRGYTVVLDNGQYVVLRKA